MFGTKPAAILILASLSAPAMAASGGFCERLATKLAAPAPAADDIETLERDLRLSIRRAAEDGCDPYGGSMAGNEYCAAHVTQIRQQVAEIQRADLHEPDDRYTLQAMYDGANCDGREAQHVVRLGDDVQLLRGRVVAVAPEAAAADQPDTARFAALDTGEPEPAPDTSVRTASVQPLSLAHFITDPAPIPEDRRNVRVVGSRFLADADSTRAFKTIATSELDLPNSVLKRILDWIGFDGACRQGWRPMSSTHLRPCPWRCTEAFLQG